MQGLNKIAESENDIGHGLDLTEILHVVVVFMHSMVQCRNLSWLQSKEIDHYIKLRFTEAAKLNECYSYSLT